MDSEKYLNKKNSEPDIDNDVIRGRRLTKLKSMQLMFPESPIIDDKVLEEILMPYIKWK